MNPLEFFIYGTFAVLAWWLLFVVRDLNLGAVSDARCDAHANDPVHKPEADSRPDESAQHEHDDLSSSHSASVYACSTAGTAAATVCRTCGHHTWLGTWCAWCER